MMSISWVPLQRFGNFFEETRVGGIFVTAVRALATVGLLVLAVCVHHGALFFGGRELPRGGLLVIEPYDGMVIGHGVSCGLIPIVRVTGMAKPTCVASVFILHRAFRRERLIGAPRPRSEDHRAEISTTGLRLTSAAKHIDENFLEIPRRPGTRSRRREAPRRGCLASERPSPPGIPVPRGNAKRRSHGHTESRPQPRTTHRGETGARQ